MIIRSSAEKQELTDLWKQRQAESELFAEMLRREQNRMAGIKTYSASDMRVEAKKLLRGG